MDPVPRLQSVVDDFETACNRLEAILHHINNSGPEDIRLRVTMLNNMVVALTATIEETIRSIFNEYLKILEEEIDDHRNLRKLLQNANLDASVLALKNLREDSERERRAEIALNLEKCIKGRQGYFLMRDDITYNQGNFRTEQVTAIAKRSGVVEMLRAVCNCEEIEELTGRDNLDARVTAISVQWNEIFAERDLVVHRISNANGWGPDRIIQAITLARLMIRRIQSCLQEDAINILEIEAQRAQLLQVVN